MEWPKVSYVVAVRNELERSKDWLRQSLDSIWNQDYEGVIELIVVDDCSTDGTWEWLQGLDYGRQSGNREFVLLRAPSRRGPYGAANLGLKSCTGDVIARQDGDDWSELDRTTKQVGFLRENGDISLVCCCFKVHRPNGMVSFGWCRGGYVDVVSFWKGNRAAHGTFMFPRRTLDILGGYDETYFYSSDFDFYWRCLEIGKVYILPDVLYHYRLHPKGISVRERGLQALFSDLVKRKISAVLRKRGVLV